jgi:diguanylate cyclase (GGDEF)-like protein/PAS domain S-box-containing protein
MTCPHVTPAGARPEAGAAPARRPPRLAATLLAFGPTPALAEALADAAQACGFAVRAEADPARAVAAVGQGEAEVVAIDAGIGAERLVELVQALHAQGGADGVPVVVAGDPDGLRARLAACACGAVDQVLAYPFDPPALQLCLGACLRMVALRRRWQAALDHVSDAVIVADGRGRVRSFNAAAQRIFQTSAVQMLGQPLTLLMPPPHRHAHDRYLEAYLTGGEARVIGRGRTEEGLRRDGTRFPMRLEVSDISDAAGVRFVGVIRDLSPERERQALHERALHDALTGLPNREHALARLQQACAQAEATGEPFALLYLDLDRFKPVNDTRGHAAGDAVLVALAGRLRHGLAARDFVARFGGDEFVVLLPAVGEREQARAVAARLRRSLAQPIVVPGGPVAVDASFGVAVWADDGFDTDALLAAADRRMYREKRTRGGAARLAPDGDG